MTSLILFEILDFIARNFGGRCCRGSTRIRGVFFKVILRLAIEYNFDIFGFRVLRAVNRGTESNSLAQHFKRFRIILERFPGKLDTLDAAELERISIARVRLRLATDVDFALIQDDHQRNPHARDVSVFADVGD